MKRLILLVFFVLSLFLFIPKTFASKIGIVNDSVGINFRSAPNTGDNVITKIKYNTQIIILDVNKYTGTGCSDGWYKAGYNNKEGYVCSTYISIIENESGTVTGGYFAKVNTSSFISVRSLPNGNSTRLDKLITGTPVNIISTHPQASGCSSNWLYVSYHDGKKGYVCGSYINTYEELTLNSSEYTEEEKAYAETLSKNGFPATYIPYLMRMHRDHPTWNFVAVNKGLNWNDVVSGEQGNNKIESTTTTELEYYIASGAVGTEGGNWYMTNSAVDAYFLDPRNFLSDVFIFMFEDLTYDPEYHTAEVLKTFFGSSYLSSDEYIGYFLEAAEKYDVSPLHLAARVYKEGGANENYGAITGTYTGYYGTCLLTGYYNYYNIGANSSWMEGLKYAAGAECGGSNTFGRPWKTRKDAIIGGANFISTNYISSGQNTLYYQKFNTASAPYYTNQYMTNIMAPTQEGESMYDTIVELSLLENAYTFEIPVYNNMPDSTGLPNIANTDNSLKSITINNKTIDNFDTDVLEYNFYVTKDTDTAIINAVTNASSSTAKYETNVKLNEEKTTITILVTAQSGHQKTYTVHIIKVESVTTINDILSKLSVKVTDNYMKNISTGTSANSLILNIRQADPNASIVYKNASGVTISNTSTFATGQTLQITSSNGESKTFTIVVTGDTNGDGEITILDLLKVQKHLLNSSKLTNSYLQAADTNADNSATILDLLRIQKHLLNEIKL